MQLSILCAMCHSQMLHRSLLCYIHSDRQHRFICLSASPPFLCLLILSSFFSIWWHSLEHTNRMVTVIRRFGLEHGPGTPERSAFSSVSSSIQHWTLAMVEWRN